MCAGIFFRRRKPAFKGERTSVAPLHADGVERGDALLGEHARGAPASHAALRGDPAPEGIPLRRLIPLWHVEIAVRLIIRARVRVHQIPRRGERILQGVEEGAALAHFVDDAKALADDEGILPRHAVVPDRRVHLLLDGADGIEVLEIVDDVQNNGRFAPAARREGAADLLLVDDGRDGRAEQDDPVHIRDMDALVEHIDAIQEL